MTVCIAARAQGMIVAASDRMLTSADIQFEPSVGTKVWGLTNSIFMLTAGDAALQGELYPLVRDEIIEMIRQQPQKWMAVSEAADMYVKYYNQIRTKRATNEILAPLQLDLNSFLANQRTMSDHIVTDLTKELLNFELPSVAAIFTGIDLTGSHIYTVRNNEVNCADNVGFAAIGIGSRHASSQFMFARHAWNSPFPEALLLTYIAKRRAEVAPGVGAGTDMVMAGPSLGSAQMVGEHVISKLEQEYKRLIQAETSAFTRGKTGMTRYVEELTKQAAEAAVAAGGQQAPPKSDGGTAPSDKPTSTANAPEEEEPTG